MEQSKGDEVKDGKRWCKGLEAAIKYGRQTGKEPAARQMVAIMKDMRMKQEEIGQGRSDFM